MWEKAEIFSANITKTVHLVSIIIMSAIQKSYAQQHAQKVLVTKLQFIYSSCPELLIVILKMKMYLK